MSPISRWALAPGSYSEQHGELFFASENLPIAVTMPLDQNDAWNTIALDENIGTKQ
jgi:hypothetical protein